MNHRRLLWLGLALLALSTPALANAQAEEEVDAVTGAAHQVEEGEPDLTGDEAIAPPPRPAVDPIVERVNALDLHAQALFDRGDFPGALREQQAAQALIPATPRVFNMAVCEERLENRDQAIELFQEFLAAEDAPPDRREQARQRITQLRQEIEAERLEAERAELARQAAVAREQQANSGPVGLSPTSFWVMVGLTSAITVAAVVTGALTLSLHEEFLSTYRGEGNSTELMETGHTLSLATNILLGFAALSALTTLVFGLDTSWRRRERDEAPVALVPSAGRGQSGLGLVGRF